MAGHRLLCGRSATRLRLCAGAGLRPDHGGDVRHPQSHDRYPLRSDRSASKARSMTDITAVPRESPLASLLRHSRHVLAENPVTDFAFALFLLILLAALFGPQIV